MAAAFPASVTVFLSGDVMTGRGVDQVCARHCDPELREEYTDDAGRYVELAERRNGPIPAPIHPAYVWGDGLALLERLRPDASVINLETSVTTAGDFWSGKGIHYRMHPANVSTLRAAHVDVAVLANNHVLDFGRPGLEETLSTLREAGIATAGAGRDRAEAWAPARVPLAGGGRLLVYGLGAEDSGIPPAWEASGAASGVALLPALSEETAAALAARVCLDREPGDLAIASIHWGGNWGYEVPRAHVAFAHRLVEGGVDLVHGHSSHHPRPIELHQGKLILYGCGDLLNDYEGIGGHEEWRGDLALLYFAELERAGGRLAGLRMAPVRTRRMRLERAGDEDRRWLRDRLQQVSGRFGVAVEEAADGMLAVRGASA
jgi:poly-gamma-glutamate synthesis protein (capsule biosynthesis protein)